MKWCAAPIIGRDEGPGISLNGLICSEFDENARKFWCLGIKKNTTLMYAAAGGLNIVYLYLTELKR